VTGRGPAPGQSRHLLAVLLVLGGLIVLALHIWLPCRSAKQPHPDKWRTGHESADPP